MQRKSEIAHHGLPFNCPHTLEDANIFIDMLKMPQNAKIIDIGCGRGELLCMLTEAFTASGFGVDSNPILLSKVRSVGKGSVTIIEADLNDWINENSKNGSKFDLIICIGSLKEGQQVELTNQMAGLLNPNGWLIVGELVWVQKPSQHFLDFLEMTEDAHLYLPEFKSHFENLNFEIKYSSVVSIAPYETSLLNNVEKWAALNPTDPDAEIILQKSREWNEFSSEHAWVTWEFATIVAQKK
jgi:trans-aconitate methyltransferase